MLTALKPLAERSLKPAAHLLRHIHPNIISLTGLVFPTLFFICLVNDWYALALFVFVFNALDMLDGMVARQQGKVTAFGGFLDSTIDRFADFTVLVAFGFAELAAWEIVLPLILLTYLISYIRSRTELAAKGTLVANVGLMERTERLILVFAGLLAYTVFPDPNLFGHNFIEVTFFILIILSAVTVGQRVAFAYQKLR